MIEDGTQARDRALDAFLGLIAEKGYAGVALRDVAQAAGLGFADVYRLYPDKISLAAAFMARIDAEVLAGTPSSIDPEETARDRLFDVMMRRYDALKPHRAALRALRRAGTRDPMLAIAMGPPLRRCWRPRRSPATVCPVRCGRPGCWPSITPCRGCSTATNPRIFPRRWRPWTIV